MAGYKRVSFYELCRLCASNHQKEKTHIFQEEGRKIQLQNKIQTCLSLKVRYKAPSTPTILIRLILGMRKRFPPESRVQQMFTKSRSLFHISAGMRHLRINAE